MSATLDQPSESVTPVCLVIILVVVLLALPLLGGFGMMGFGMMGPGMMNGMMGGYGYGFNPFRMVLGLVFWALIMGGSRYW